MLIKKSKAVISSLFPLQNTFFFWVNRGKSVEDDQETLTKAAVGQMKQTLMMMIREWLVKIPTKRHKQKVHPPHTCPALWPPPPCPLTLLWNVYCVVVNAIKWKWNKIDKMLASQRKTDGWLDGQDQKPSPKPRGQIWLAKSCPNDQKCRLSDERNIRSYATQGNQERILRKGVSICEIWKVI